jgi:hypothetical protein
MNKLSPNEGLTEEKWYSTGRLGPYPQKERLITAFWWKPDNEVYAIAEEDKNSRIYKIKFSAENKTCDFHLIVSLK